MPKDFGGRTKPRSAGRERSSPRRALRAAPSGLRGRLPSSAETQRLRPQPQPAHPQRAPPARVELAPEFSAAQGAAPWQKIFCLGLLIGSPLMGILAPALALALGALTLGGLILGFLALRLSLLQPWGKPQPGSLFLRRKRRKKTPPPEISLLIALYQETAIAPHLVAALDKLKYPREKLEALILLEEDDRETIAAFSRLKLPDWIRVEVVPPGWPRTKPRALNHGLALTRGEIIGIFDAEDQPEHDQLRKVAAAFAEAPPDLVCLQARLGWWNAPRNGLTRGLALEYAMWFGLLLPGLARRGWPIPLGGTSCYIRAEVLRDLGGWDAHNVTEDADLGFRLARRGMRCATLDSTTWEEAVLTPKAWIRQRTRWIKGFLSTWITHMRDPFRLWRELGPAGFCVFNALTIGSFFAYLSLPLHLGAVLWMAATGAAPWDSVLSPPVGDALSGIFWGGQAAAVTMAVWGAALIYGARFTIWAPFLPFYLAVLGPVAALRVLNQLRRAGAVWEKTAHGIDPKLKAV